MIPSGITGAFMKHEITCVLERHQVTYYGQEGLLESGVLWPLRSSELDGRVVGFPAPLSLVRALSSLPPVGLPLPDSPHSRGGRTALGGQAWEEQDTREWAGTAAPEGPVGALRNWVVGHGEAGCGTGKGIAPLVPVWGRDREQ